MAPPSRRPALALAEILGAEPHRFDFFQAVRLLGLLRPGRAAVGRSARPGREIVRFAARLGLAFPPSSIHTLNGLDVGAGAPRADDPPPVMTVAFLGLTGPSGAMPHAYTELVQERRRAGDAGLAAFLDLFNHRLISLFYRAWEKHRPLVADEQARLRAVAHGRPDDDGLNRHLMALIGLGLPALRDRQGLPDSVPLAYANLFARRQRPAVMLSAMLLDYADYPVEVIQFQGSWLALDPADRSRMGRAGGFNRLGVDLVVGGRVRDVQGRFRLRIGPLDLGQYRALLPGGPSLRPLAELTRLYVGGELSFDVQLVLKADQVPPCRLGATPGAGARLGRDAWLVSRPREADADEAVFPSGV
ncbi:type VI secretion system baseplate subunit TssG [Isosphaeraceae bacterium EP7]